MSHFDICILIFGAKFKVLIFFQTCTIYSSRGGISTQRDPAQP